MGFRCSWVAVHAMPLDDVLAALGLERTGERGDFSEPGLNAIEARDGWNIVISDGWDHMDQITAAHAGQLSAGTRAMFFRCEDSSMVTELHEFHDGAPTWSIRYSGSEGVSSPVVSGELPAVAARVIAEREQEQAAREDDDVDCLYEITPTIGLHVTGFRHDNEPEGIGPEPIQELRWT